MNNYTKFVKKYAAHKGVILPPPSELEGKIDVPTETSDMDPKWISLIEESEGMDPLTEKPSQTQEEILKDLPGSDPPSLYEKELLKVLQPEFYSTDQEASTKPPPKRSHSSSDKMLRLCSKFYDLCHKF
jgi:hypothetical protein